MPDPSDQDPSADSRAPEPGIDRATDADAAIDKALHVELVSDYGGGEDTIPGPITATDAPSGSAHDFDEQGTAPDARPPLEMPDPSQFPDPDDTLPPGSRAYDRHAGPADTQEIAGTPVADLQPIPREPGNL